MGIPVKTQRLNVVAWHSDSREVEAWSKCYRVSPEDQGPPGVCRVKHHLQGKEGHQKEKKNRKLKFFDNYFKIWLKSSFQAIESPKWGNRREVSRHRCEISVKQPPLLRWLWWLWKGNHQIHADPLIPKAAREAMFMACSKWRQQNDWHRRV